MLSLNLVLVFYVSRPRWTYVSMVEGLPRPRLYGTTGTWHQGKGDHDEMDLSDNYEFKLPVGCTVYGS